jgi:hypothetical protein
VTTLAPAALINIYKAIEASDQYGSMRRGGIVGDVRHQARGGYHISRADQTSSSNYSVQAPADKRGPSNLASGIDLTMSPSDMKKMTSRLMAACKTNHANPAAEPRIECIREFFGTLNGTTVTGWNRYASSNRGVGYTTSDSSHLWHVHVSIFRDYCDDPAKMKGLVDILLGTTTTSLPDEGDDMTAADVWDKDLTLGPGVHSAGWYIREIHKLTKAANARTMVLAGATEKILAKLAADDPGEAQLQADLASIRAELEALNAEEELPEAAEGEGAGPADPYAPPHETDPK